MAGVARAATAPRPIAIDGPGEHELVRLAADLRALRPLLDARREQADGRPLTDQDTQHAIDDYVVRRMSPFALIRSILRPGMTVVDVGANVGDLTWSMREAVGPGGHVYAIEPCAETVRAAEAHRQALETSAPRGVGLAPVTWLTMALGRRDGEAVLYHSDAPPRHTLYPANIIAGAGAGRQESVPVRTFDRLQRDGQLPRRIDLIKIDAQGAEDDILDGASVLLAEGRTIWMLEIWPAGLFGAGSSVAHLVDRLQSAHLHPIDQTWPEVLALATSCQGHAAVDVVVCPR